MLLLVIALIVYAFLVLGAIAFTVCVAFPRLRRYALSVACWFAAFGMCLAGLLLAAGLAAIAGYFAGQHTGVSISSEVVRQFLLRGSVLAGVVIIVIASTAIAWLHQFLIHRMTFALFRLYVAAICAGIGSVWAILLLVCLTGARSRYALPITLVGSMTLCITFGMTAFRYASVLRGHSPNSFSWVTKEEYAEPSNT